MPAAAITTAGTLIAAITTLLRRDDLETEYPLFIQLAERRIARDLQSRADHAIVASQSLPANAVSFTLPITIKSLIDVTESNNKPLSIVDLNQINNFKKNGNSVYGGTYGAIFAREFYVYPVSAAARTFTLYYTQRMALDSTVLSSTNTVLNDYPELYLYACLFEIAESTKDLTDAAKYEKRYMEALAMACESERYAGQNMFATPSNVV
jgi:hypothetical protein